MTTSQPASPESAPTEPLSAEPVTEEAPPLRGPVLMHQHWRDLTYVHWAVDPRRLAPLMPPGVRPDVHDGTSWVGLVPFRMVGAAPGRGRPVPWLGTFLETNVRLYSVDRAGRRGVVFLSLDCDRLAIVLAARGVLGLPYRWARLHHEVTAGDGGGERHTYEGSLPRALGQGRGSGPGSRLVLDAGPGREASPLDTFLSARWGLHTRRAGRTLYVPNRHEVWPLREATVVELRTGGLLASVGLPELEDRAPDHTAFSSGVHAEFGLPRDRPPVTAGPVDPGATEGGVSR
jgi:uncharacterized protein YqjF (DUF2071 family)